MTALKFGIFQQTCTYLDGCIESVGDELAGEDEIIARQILAERCKEFLAAAEKHGVILSEKALEEIEHLHDQPEPEIVKPFRCSHCKKFFKQQVDFRQHNGRVHRGNARCLNRDGSKAEKQPKKIKIVHDDDYEPSYADMLVEARIDRACGEEIDDDLADVLDIEDGL